MKKSILFLSALILLAGCNSLQTATYQDDLVMPLAEGQEDSLFFALSLEYATGGLRIPPMESLNQTIMQQAFDLEDASGTLGHEMELGVSYRPIHFVNISAGYSYMHGSSTLERLQRVEGKNNLHWAWLMLTVTPRIFSKRW